MSIGLGLNLICGNSCQGDAISYLDMGEHFFSGDPPGHHQRTLESALSFRPRPDSLALQGTYLHVLSH